MAINLTAPQRITDELLTRSLLRKNGRVVGVSSISGIAGNAGQTNYSTSKAGVIGFVRGQRPGAGQAGDHDQRGRARVHRDQDDGRDAVRACARPAGG